MSSGLAVRAGDARSSWPCSGSCWKCAALGSAVAVSTKNQQRLGTLPWDFKNFP